MATAHSVKPGLLSSERRPMRRSCSRLSMAALLLEAGEVARREPPERRAMGAGAAREAGRADDRIWDGRRSTGGQWGCGPLVSLAAARATRLVDPEPKFRGRGRGGPRLSVLARWPTTE